MTTNIFTIFIIIRVKQIQIMEMFTLQIPNSLGDKFSRSDSQNETFITHYEKKNRNHDKFFLF